MHSAEESSFNSFYLANPCRCHNIVGRCYASFKQEFDKGLISFQKELKINIKILGAITYQAMADFLSASSSSEASFVT